MSSLSWICRHCREPYGAHADTTKCLYAPGVFEVSYCTGEYCGKLLSTYNSEPWTPPLCHVCWIAWELSSPPHKQL